MFTERQTDNPIFYKAETYLDHLLVFEIHVIPCFVKIIRTVLEIYERCVYEQTDNPIFYKAETYLDRLLMPEIYAIPNFVKVVRVVRDFYKSCVHRQTDKQTTRFFTKMRPIYTLNSKERIKIIYMYIFI